MRRFRFLPCLIIMAVLALGSFGVAAMEIFPLDEIKPGLWGIGKTVVEGTKIEKFDVEVLGLVPQSPPLQDLIMVRVSGEPMDKTGGIALGMSGTPVYIDNQLLGAIGYTYSLTDHRIGLVTPAETMFSIYDLLPGGDQAPPPGAVPVGTPLLVGGMNNRSIGLLEEALAGSHVRVMAAPAQVGKMQGLPLEAGSMIGVQLLRGDFQVASFGTVTHVLPDGRFIAFGHPFTHWGTVNFFATDAYVHYTLASLEVPYKIVSLGSTIGGILQDRAAGLGGSLNFEPPFLPVTIVVRDKNRGLYQEYRVESITDARMMIPLVISSACQSVDATLDRVGEGTSYVRLEFTTGNLSQRMIRENLFFSDSDIAVWSLTDLLDGLELLANNNLEDPDLQEVLIEIDITGERQTATIENANPNVFNVVAGDSIDIEVLIRPYRSALETRIVRLDIPGNTIPGPMTVTVRSGGAGYFVSKPPVKATLPEVDDDQPSRAVISGVESLDILVGEYMDRERNNEIIAEFYPYLENLDNFEQAEEAGMNSRTSIYGWPDGSGEAHRARLTTQFVLDGMASFEINVLGR